MSASRILILETSHRGALEEYLATVDTRAEFHVLTREDVSRYRLPNNCLLELAPQEKGQWLRWILSSWRRERWSEVVLLQSPGTVLPFRVFVLASLIAPWSPVRLHTSGWKEICWRKGVQSLRKVPRGNSRLQAGYVGRFDQESGTDIILELARRVRDVDFHIFGGTEQDLLSWRETAAGPSNLVFHGYIPPALLPSCYAMLDVLLAPYQKDFSAPGMRQKNEIPEASSFKIIEYMEAARPILASDLPSLTGILSHDETALICAPRQVSEWEAALRRLMKDATLRRRLGKSARREFLEKYTDDARVPHVLNGYPPVSPSGVVPALYYLLHWKGGSSVDRKVLARIKYLNEEGYPCHGLFATDLGFHDLPVIPDVTFIPFTPAARGRLNSWFHYYNDYYAAIIRHVTLTLDPDAIVLLGFPLLIDLAFHKFIVNMPLTIYAEHNTKELDESVVTLRSQPSPGDLSPSQKLRQRITDKWNMAYYHYADRFWKPKILHRISKGFCVTSEIATYEKKYYAEYNTCVISNSFDVTSASPRSAPQYDGTVLNILVISGCRSNWFGLDLIIASLKRYSGGVKVVLRCVGEFREEVVREAGELVFHEAEFLPYLRGEDLAAQFNQCHIAVGSMALFRNNMEEASTLKTREYMARGIPFVIGYADTDLMNDRRWDPYYLRIPEPQAGIAFSEIIAFATRVLSRPTHSAEMRELALETIHTPVKIRRLIEELRSRM